MRRKAAVRYSGLSLGVGLVFFWVLSVFASTVDLETYQQKYPDANLVVLYDSTFYDVEASGEFVEVAHYKSLILTERGVKWNAQDATGYYAGYDTVIVLGARVIGPDGSVVEVGADNIKDIPIPAFGPFFLKNVREVIVTFPNLMVGSQVEMKLKIVRRNPPMDDQFNYLNFLRGQIPYESRYLRVALPEEKPLRWQVVRGEVDFREETTDGKHYYIWEVPESEQIIPEIGMAPFPEIAPQLIATTIPTWKDVSSWYADVCDSCLIPDEAVKQKVKEIVQGKTSTDEKIRALYYWVAQNIRYVETSMTGEKAGFKPEPAGVTLSNAYGVCRDKAALLVSMLREIGVDANVVLVNASFKMEVGLPNIYFNHAIAAVMNPDGSYYLMDPTAEDAVDFLPAFDQDKWVLVCTPEGRDIEMSPLKPPEDNRFHVTAKSQVNREGFLNSTVTIRASGMFDFIFRSWLNSIPPSRREDMYKGFVQQVSPAAKLVHFDLTDLDDLYQPVKLEIAYEASDYSLEAGNYFLFKIPNQTDAFDFLGRNFLRGANLETRKYPMKVFCTFSILVEESVKYPKGYKIRSLPDPLDRDEGDFSYRVEYGKKRNRVDLTKELRVATLYFPLDKYENLRGMLKEKEHSKDGQVILVKKQGLFGLW